MVDKPKEAEAETEATKVDRVRVYCPESEDWTLFTVSSCVSCDN